MKIEIRKPEYRPSKLRESNVYIRQGRNGKVYAIQREENYQQTRTEEQAKMRSSFGQLSHQVYVWMHTPENLSSETYAKAERAFKRQDRYTTIRGFLMANADKYGIV